MPDKNVLLILDRAFADEEFLCRLEADLEGTVRSLGLELSDEALAELMTALDEGHDFATGLDQRLSQSGFALNPASLIRQKGASGKQMDEFGQQTDFSRKTKARYTGKRSIREVDTARKEEGVSNEPLEADEFDIEVEND
jgi:hypothetical protein